MEAGAPQLAQAIAEKVRRLSFLGIEKDDWSGLFWAFVLLMLTVAGLSVAVKEERNKEDFC